MTAEKSGNGERIVREISPMNVSTGMEDNAEHFIFRKRTRMSGTKTFSPAFQSGILSRINVASCPAFQHFYRGFLRLL